MVFHPLSRENMHEIITLLCSNLAARCQEQMQIRLTVSNSLKEHIIEKYADYRWGQDL